MSEDRSTTIRISEAALAKIDEYRKRLASASAVPVKVSRSSVIETAIEALERAGSKTEPFDRLNGEPKTPSFERSKRKKAKAKS